MITLSVVATLVGTIALLTLACSLLERLWPSDAPSEPLRCAAFLILTLALIYLEVVLTGAVHCFSWPLLAALNVVVLSWLSRRDRGALRKSARLALRTASLPFTDCRGLADRAFVAWLALLISVEGIVPKSVGDDVDYHLPNIMQMVRSGATLQVLPGHGVDLRAPTAYYARGFEAILALFFQAPGAQLYTVAVALAVLTIVYACLLDFSGRPPLARALTFFLATSLLLGAPYKGDYLIGALSLFVMTILIRHGERVALAALPVFAALMLLLAIKSSTLLLVSVASILTARSLRARWPATRIALVLFVTVLLGLAFYLGNLVYLGNPVFPFRVTLGARRLFPGPAVRDLFPTTILANLGPEIVAPFVRGIARVTSPLALLAGLALPWRVWRYFRAPASGDVRWMAALFLACGVLSFASTPFSDNNGGGQHSQLYSGHTLRMALPVVLLTLGLSASPAGSGSERAAARVARILALLAAVNIVWYDGVALALKPASAFVRYAPLLQSFDVRVLAAGFATLTALALLAAYALAPLRVLAGASVAAALIAPFVEVSSYAYSPGFRSLGHSSHIVEQLSALADHSKVVSVLSAGATGPLRGVITPALYRNFRSFELARTAQEAQSCDLIVVPSLVAEQIGDFVSGRSYTLERPSAALEQLTHAGYRRTFEDPLYSVFSKSSPP